MFAYFGSKRALAHLYPEPLYDLIVEPFAGSASYALHGDRWQRDVLLYERDEQLAEVWRWLIDEATAAKIDAIPGPLPGERSVELLAIAGVVNQHAGARGNASAVPGPAATWEESRSLMAADVHKVKHWQLRRATCFEAPDVVATWFVDPPYEGPVGSGYAYGSSSLDFSRLAAWTRSRPGQVIACESGCASYLPFRPLRPGVDRRGDPHAEFVWCDRRPDPGGIRATERGGNDGVWP